MRGLRYGEIELRAELSRRVQRVLDRPSVGGIHEAAHEYVAKMVGCTNVGTFVDRHGKSGRCYYTFPKTYLAADGFRRPLGLNGIRQRARILMAGWAAEAIAEGRNVPSWGELFRTEGVIGEPDANPLAPFVWHATDEFKGDADRAFNWLKSTLPEERQLLIYDLRLAWPQIMRRARQLDDKWKARATCP